MDLSAAVAAETEVPGSGEFGNGGASPWLGIALVAGLAGAVLVGSAL
jgi:hypothetical protein